jgi:hypothetical protein
VRLEQHRPQPSSTGSRATTTHRRWWISPTSRRTPPGPASRLFRARRRNQRRRDTRRGQASRDTPQRRPESSRSTARTRTDMYSILSLMAISGCGRACRCGPVAGESSNPKREPHFLRARRSSELLVTSRFRFAAAGAFGALSGPVRDRHRHRLRGRGESELYRITLPDEYVRPVDRYRRHAAAQGPTRRRFCPSIAAGTRSSTHRATSSSRQATMRSWWRRVWAPSRRSRSAISQPSREPPRWCRAPDGSRRWRECRDPPGSGS